MDAFMRFTLLLLLGIISLPVNAEHVFQSSQNQTKLIELYSSQGCSSCPPAERWISRLKDSSRLWNDFIPIVFHVDYWNYLGWRDPYSQQAYSQRQRLYHQQGNIRSVYTPGFVVNGKEWRGWFRRQALAESATQPGKLVARLNNNQLSVQFAEPSRYTLHVSYLASGLSTDIKRGENGGKQVTEDFIALNLLSYVSDNGQWQVQLPSINHDDYKELGIAIWVSEEGKLKPIQATGGWLKTASSE